MFLDRAISGRTNSSKKAFLMGNMKNKLDFLRAFWLICQMPDIREKATGTK